MKKIIVNKKGQILHLSQNSEGYWEQDGTDGRVRFNGNTCMEWHERQESFFMHTDPRMDIEKELNSTQELMDLERLKNGSW